MPLDQCLFVIAAANVDALNRGHVEYQAFDIFLP